MSTRRSAADTPLDDLLAPGPESARRRRSVGKLIVVGALGGMIVAAGLTPELAGASAAAKTASAVWVGQSDTIPAPVLPGRTTVVDARGKLVAQAFTIDRIPVTAAQQGTLIRQGVVAIEDARFYKHSGVDPVGTVRALLSNGSGSGVQGGSTITQQYAKNLRVTEATLKSEDDVDAEEIAKVTERSLSRKLAEAHLAMLIESKMSKDEILTGYLNLVYFGAGAYGIEAAAHRYFSVSAAQLTLPQAALLAGILQSPAYLDPRTNPTGALERRRQVLKAMAAQGDITAADAAAASATALDLRLSLPTQGCKTARPAWAMACDAALRELKTAQWLGPQGSSLIGAGGMTVKLTLDPKAQAETYQAASQVIPADNRVANAIAMVEPGTGAIKAMASNRRFGDGKGATEIPLATTKSFAPASTFKLFTLVAALEAGIPLSTVLPGGSSYVSDKFDNPPGGYHNAEGLSEDNITITRATQMSINTAYVQLEEMVGVAAVADVARRLGITSIPPEGTKKAPGKKEGSFALGVRDVSVSDMAGAYAAIANHGRWCAPSLIESVTLPGGKTITNPAKDACKQVVDPAVADTATSVLASVITEGTGKPAALPGREVAGKTGTGEDDSSAWFAGFAPQIAAVVWTGDPKSPNNTLHGVLGLDTVYGGTLPADLWRAGMLSYLDKKPALPLPGIDPDYLSAPGAPAGDRVTMVDVTGQTADVAVRTLQAMGLAVTVVEVPALQATWVRPGAVVDQSKKSGSYLPPGTTVQLSVRAG